MPLPLCAIVLSVGNLLCAAPCSDHRIRWACGASMEHIGRASSGVRTQVGLVGRIRLGHHHRGIQKRKTRGTANRGPIHLAQLCVLDVVVLRVSTQPNQDSKRSPIFKFTEAPSNCNLHPTSATSGSVEQHDRDKAKQLITDQFGSVSFPQSHTETIAETSSKKTGATSQHWCSGQENLFQIHFIHPFPTCVWDF